MSKPAGFIEGSLDGRGYVVYNPGAVEEPKPAILFLHGAGESGKDNLRQVIQGIGSAVMWDRDRWPFLIVFAQKPEVRELWPTQVEHLNGILKATEAEHSIDPHRRYLTGLSQGGHGTFHLVKKLAWQFAAAAPVCGWCSPETAVENFSDIPIWAFHGGADPVVPPKGSTEPIEALIAKGCDAKVTIYEGVDHNSWDKAYRESDLPTWLLGHSLR
jgi:predicted peptidase